MLAKLLRILIATERELGALLQLAEQYLRDRQERIRNRQHDATHLD